MYLVSVVSFILVLSTVYGSWLVYFLGEEEYPGEYDGLKGLLRTLIVSGYCFVSFEDRVTAFSVIVAQFATSFGLFMSKPETSTGLALTSDWDITTELFLQVQHLLEILPFVAAVLLAYNRQKTKEETFWEPKESDSRINALRVPVRTKPSFSKTGRQINIIKPIKASSTSDEGRGCSSLTERATTKESLILTDEGPILSSEDEAEASESENELSTNSIDSENEEEERKMTKRHSVFDVAVTNDNQENQPPQRNSRARSNHAVKPVKVPTTLSPHKKQSSALERARLEAARLQQERANERIRQLRQRRTKT
mmetsp:Transcript_5247/g.6016  ORF Transcript_5247/g.6016 Transcript_5247/m.6016 type:complete len:311 (+) Transcript_5247:251-1183(+)